MVPYLVSRFDRPTISALVRESFGYSFPDIFKKEQIGYIFHYLKDLCAKTVLLENDYVDKDFLEDYSRYYVKRFGNDGHKCARLHFFSAELDHGRISEALAGENADERRRAQKQIQGSYLGFVVIKPLPKTFIGKTCLKLSNPSINESKDVKIRLARTYHVDLFGLSLSVESIAFQEQDKVVSACATTAIWTLLHALPWRDSRSIPSCSEITTNAINHIADSSNSFPNKGLSNKQILRALDLEGLRHHTEINFESQEGFLELIRVHIDSRLPLILGGTVYSLKSGVIEEKGGHAISVLGYRDKQSEKAIYVHDDRLGPYARASLLDNNYSETPRHLSWVLGFRNKDGDGKWQDFHEIFIPNIAIVASDKKARLSYLYALRTCQAIIDQYASVVEVENAPLLFSLKLSEINSVRQEVISHEFRNAFPVEGETEKDVSLLKKDWGQHKVEFLTGSYARLQWEARFSLGGHPIFRILVDATDIPQGDAVSAVYQEDMSGADMVFNLFRGVNFGDIVEVTFIESFIRKLTPRDENQELYLYLDSKYGAVRAPRYLKDVEYKGGNIQRNGTARPYYDSPRISISDLFPDLADGAINFILWVISFDGALLMGKEVNGLGHPCLTGFKPARIAGELHRTDGGWEINSKSGRYSGDYSNSDELLENALTKFRVFFPGERFEIQLERYV